MSDDLKLAKHYFDLSNAGNLAEIACLFTPSSTYSSANTGLYLGVDEIMSMQSAFFAGYQTLSWAVKGVEEIKPGVILFDFTFTGTTLDGNVISRDGLEHVIVFQGKIQHIEVRNQERTE